MKLPSGFDTPVLIGHGSFGTVYRVRQKQLDRQVVIKMIPLSKKKVRESHFQEAVTLAKLHLPCTPQIYDVFIWKSNICIVMQWIRSLNLQICISLNLNKNSRLEIAEGLIKAVGLLHESGYAHRDLKPANILFSPSDGIYLIDFGFAFKYGSTDNTKKIKGTPGFMAPEIFESHDNNIDYYRADCYALGIILGNVLGIDNQSEFIKILTDNDPQKRPANAVEAYKLWREQYQQIEASGLSMDMDQTIRKSLCGFLIDSSSRLLKIKRYNEAYRLCLECIQELPDNPEALKLMSTFGNDIGRKNLKFKLILTGTVFFAILIVFSINLFLHQQHKLNDSVRAVTQYPAQRSFHTSIAANKKNVSIEYRYRPSETPSLISDVYFKLKNVSCSIFVDGKYIGKKEKRETVFYYKFPAGSYRISFVDSNGNLIASEQLDILPFRSMYVNAVVQQNK